MARASGGVNNMRPLSLGGGGGHKRKRSSLSSIRLPTFISNFDDFFEGRSHLAPYRANLIVFHREKLA